MQRAELKGWEGRGRNIWSSSGRGSGPRQPWVVAGTCPLWAGSCRRGQEGCSLEEQVLLPWYEEALAAGRSSSWVF